MKVLKWIWQFPQNLVGFLLTRKPETVKEYKDVKVYYTHNVFGCGVSLGDFIVLDAQYNDSSIEDITTRHEYGHHRQSIFLGWLYLPVVGLWSAIRNRYDVWFHKDWPVSKREAWYYAGYPENWADKLGEANRVINENDTAAA